MAAIEAGGVWTLVIFLGLALKLADVEVYEDVGSFFAGLTGINAVAMPLLVFAIVTIMISTIDAVMSTMAYVSYYDIIAKQTLATDDTNSSDGTDDYKAHLKRPRLTMLVTVLVIYIIYQSVRYFVRSDRIDAAIYTIYAVQLSIGVVIVVALIKPESLRIWPSLLSILLGSVAALAVAFSIPRFGFGDDSSWLPDDSWWVLPPLVAFVCSVVVYRVTMLFYQKRS